MVCDVSGLGRLLGEPAAIGAELARAAAVYGPAVRVAIAPTMTASMLLTLAYAELTVVTDGHRGGGGEPAAGAPAAAGR